MILVTRARTLATAAGLLVGGTLRRLHRARVGVCGRRGKGREGIVVGIGRHRDGRHAAGESSALILEAYGAIMTEDGCNEWSASSSTHVCAGLARLPRPMKDLGDGLIE